MNAHTIRPAVGCRHWLWILRGALALALPLTASDPAVAQAGQCTETGWYGSYPLITGAAIWDIHEGSLNGPEGYAYFQSALGKKRGTLPSSLGGRSGWPLNVWASNFLGPVKVRDVRDQWEWTADGWLEVSTWVYPAESCQQWVASPADFSARNYTILEDDEEFGSDYVGAIRFDHRYCKSEVFDAGLSSGWTWSHSSPRIGDIEYVRYELYCRASLTCRISTTCPDGTILDCTNRFGSGCAGGACQAGPDWVRCGDDVRTCAGAPPPPPPPVHVPTQPTGLRAVPVVGGLTGIDLTWRDNSGNEVGFEIQRVLTRTGQVRRFEVEADRTSFHDDVGELPPSGVGHDVYRYRVRAYNSAGRPEWANVPMVEARIFGDAPPKPDTLRPRNCIDTLRPTLSWRGGNGASQYYVRLLDAATGDEAMPDQTPLEPSVPVPADLVAGRAYMLRVWGMNNIGNGAGSDPQYFVPYCSSTPAPEVEAPAAGCAGTTTPVVQWTPVPNALSYHLRINLVNPVLGDPEVIPGGVGVGSTITSWPVPAGLLSPGREYRVKVKAFTGADGPYSRLRYFLPGCGSSSLGTASPMAPYGGPVSSSRPTYTWEPAAQAESYTLKVITEAGQFVGEAGFGAAGICDTHTCSARPSFALADGTYRWWLASHRASQPDVVGPYVRFTVARPPLEVWVSDAQAWEGTTDRVSEARFSLHLSQPATEPVTVHFATADGSAQAPADYVAVSDSVVFGAGQETALVAVPLVQDAVHEPDETFSLRLTGATGAQITGGLATATIVNDDLAPHDAEFLAQSVPAVMVAGEHYAVSVTVRNAGAQPWSPVGPQCNAYRLGAPTGNTWGLSRVELPSPVLSGETATLAFTVTAPTTVGSHSFQWRMLQECVQWFGALSPAVSVTVRARQPKDAQVLAQEVPTSMQAGHSYPVTATVKNVGTMAWDPVGPTCGAYRLGSTESSVPPTWGISRVELTEPAGPGEEVRLGFVVTAPSQPGTYGFGWRMVHECVEWFGDRSPAVPIAVIP